LLRARGTVKVALMKKVLTILGVAFLLAIAGCGADDASNTSNGEGASEEVSEVPRERFATISRQEGSPKPLIDPSDLPPPKKVIVRDIRVGDGPVARKGDRVAVYYLGVNYKTGEEMFWRWAPQQPFEFELGLSTDAWNDTVEGMRVGGRREYIVPSHLAFGTGALNYVVDLLAVKPASKGAAQNNSGGG
jgi:peptidylprolyl isomerase